MTALEWTQVGEEIFTTPPTFEGNMPEGGGRYTHEMVEKAIEALDWQEVTDDLELAAMPGYAIANAIAEYRIPKVSRVAVSSDLAPYGFYGIEGNYTNGRARVYIVDRGTELIPVASHLLIGLTQEQTS